MHLLDLLAVRTTPAAGIYLGLTRRCPLSCAHCSTASTLASEEHADELFVRFVESFTPDDHPEMLVISGGEALLRPRLVQRLTASAHAAGARVALISGMFFARQPTIPPAIDRAIADVDHFIASLDIFHEQEVAREDVFRVLQTLIDGGQDVSLQIVGLGAADPYLADVTSAVRTRFDDHVPMLVGSVGAVGRAHDWVEAPRPRAPREVQPSPCAKATWPVVAFDGTVVGCCNQDVIDGDLPAHLRLGHVLVDDWPTIRERCLARPMLQGLRVFGPQYLMNRFGSGRCDGYCDTCVRLSNDDAVGDAVERLVQSPTMARTEAAVTELLSAMPLAGSVPAYAGLAALGQRAKASV
jgi:hypothetical protein